MSTAKITATATTVLLSIILFIAATLTSVASTLTGGIGAIIAGGTSTPRAGDTDCVPTGSTSAVPGYGADQMANAATIIAVGQQLNVPTQGQIVAIAAAITESGLRNLNHGDRDSLGLFQQRPSQGWGTPAQVTNPTYAATQFYQHLLATPGWRNMTTTQAAQAVQRSALPNAYATHEQAARTIVAATQGLTCTPTSSTSTRTQTPGPASTGVGANGCGRVQAPSAAALAAVRFACTQLGKPYAWGGNGNPGFDCSGLTHAAYQAAGLTLPRTAQTQYQNSPALPGGTPLQPGDLLFFGTPNNIHHVAISLGGTAMIHAPTFGQPVQIADYRTQRDFLAVSRPAGASQQ